MRFAPLLLVLASASLSPPAFAGGFALSEQSVSARGTANAGRASNVADASVAYNNPAALVRLAQPQFTFALPFVDARTRIANNTGVLPSPPFTNEGDIIPRTALPSAYFASGNRGGWAWGLATYGSFGLKTNYEDTFQGRFLGDESSIEVIAVQPAFSFLLTDRIAVGVGPTLNRLDATLSQNTTGLPGAAGALEEIVIAGRDVGYGFNLGLHANLTPATQFGAVYRSKVDYRIGDGTFTSSAAAPFGGARHASAGITLPESVELSLSHRLTASTAVHATAIWTHWSRIRQLAVTVDPALPVVGQPPPEVFAWKDTMEYAVGVTHAWSDALELRAGLAYDEAPMSAAHLSVRLPGGSRRIASLGAGYRLSSTRTVDVSCTHLEDEEAHVRQPGYSADFDNSATVYAVQFTQKF